MMPRIALAILMAVCVAAPAVAFDATRLQPSEISVDSSATVTNLRDLTISKEDWLYLLASMPADLKAQGGLSRIRRTQSWSQRFPYTHKGTPPSCDFKYAPNPSPPAITGYRLVSRVITINGSPTTECTGGYDGTYGICYGTMYSNRPCEGEFIYDYITN